MERWHLVHLALAGKAPSHYSSIETDARYDSYIKKITADAIGNFEFSDIPAGEYYIECSIFWEVADQYGMIQTGARARKQVKVANGEKLKVILTE